jgi:hypothetical protein
MGRLIGIVFLVAGLALAAPAMAGNDKIPGGDPCGTGPGQGTGNPCKGNHGNQGKNGNNGDDGTWNYHPDPFTISRPGNDRGAYITQIGDAGSASITQTANTQYARIDQRNGDGNRADVHQSGDGAHYALIDQNGSANQLDLGQSGLGAQVALLRQTGNANSMTLDQHGGVLSSGVAASQQGDNNRIELAQSGDRNQALLAQNGSGNAMTVLQTGGNNQLAWTQNGDNHSDLGISQTGGDAVAVTQSW